MGNFFPQITEKQSDLIQRAPLFFIASADPSLQSGKDDVGPVNVSPKGGVPLHILSPNRVAFLDYPGSGNETARHAEDGGPVTVMVCSFEREDAAIVRLYGKAKISPIDSSPLRDQLMSDQASELKAPRQIIEVDVERTQTSCGYGVPVMEMIAERTKLDRGRRYKGDKKPS